MLIIRAQNSNLAWRETFVRLYTSKECPDNDKYFRDKPAVIVIEKPRLDKPDPLFPMPAEELKVINQYICSGKNEQQVTHKWTELYHQRIFSKSNNQMEYFLDEIGREITNSNPAPTPLISLWNKNLDQYSRILPCTLTVWGRTRKNQLELHVHAHSSDAYKKLLMNIQEFISLQLYVAKKKNLKIGSYYHFLDSCHIHQDDLEAATGLFDELHQDNESTKNH